MADVARLRARVSWHGHKRNNLPYMRQWRSDNPERYRFVKKRHYEANKPRIIEKQVSYLSGARYKARQAVLDKFGRVCNKCGFTDERALQIDHVHGGGRAERNGKRQTTTVMAFLRRVLADRDGEFQLLCANCNWIKRDENNEVSRSRWRARHCS